MNYEGTDYGSRDAKGELLREVQEELVKLVSFKVVRAEEGMIVLDLGGQGSTVRMLLEPRYRSAGYNVTVAWWRNARVWQAFKTFRQTVKVVDDTCTYVPLKPKLIAKALVGAGLQDKEEQDAIAAYEAAQHEERLRALAQIDAAKARVAALRLPKVPGLYVVSPEPGQIRVIYQADLPDLQAVRLVNAILGVVTA